MSSGQIGGHPRRSWRSRRLVATAALAFASHAARAWEAMPEFQSLTEEEQAGFEGPWRLAPDNPADIVTYLKPQAWTYSWLTHARAFDASIGSTSAVHFRMDNRVKIHEPLTDHLDFRFTYVDERTRERDGQHAIVELVAWPWQKIVALSLYAEPQAYKRQEDTGVALVAQPAPNQEYRLFNTFVDVLRQKRNDLADRFDVDHLPYARGAVARLWADPESGRRDFIELAFRDEPRTHWLFTTQKYDYWYEKRLALVNTNKTLPGGWDLFVRAQWDLKHEEREYAADSPLDERGRAYRHRTTRVLFLAGATLPALGPWHDWSLSPGLSYGWRDWRMDEARLMRTSLSTWLPYVWAKFPAFSRPGLAGGRDRDAFQIGYVGTYWDITDPDGVVLDAYRNDQWGNRLNVSYDFRFGARDPAGLERAELRLVASGDLDQIFTRYAWAGGDVQFRFWF